MCYLCLLCKEQFSVKENHTNICPVFFGPKKHCVSKLSASHRLPSMQIEIQGKLSEEVSLCESLCVFMASDFRTQMGSQWLHNLP